MTTVSQSPARLASEGGRKLLGILDGVSVPLRDKLEPGLVVRRSCGCPHPVPSVDFEKDLNRCQEALQTEARESSLVMELADRLRLTAENLQACRSFPEVVETLGQNLDRMGYPALMAASYQEELLNGFKEKIKGGQGSPVLMDDFLLYFIRTGDTVRSKLKKAADLVNTFKQASADQDEEVLGPFTLGECLDLIVQSHRFQWTSAGVEVIQTGDETLTIKSYPGALYRAVSCLLSNSLIHGFPENTGGRINLGFEDRNPKVLIWYEDNGLGIPEELQPRVFEPFFTTKRGRGGIGLGLHTVFNVVTHILGGTISFTSQPGIKTRFEILIPKTVSW